RGSIAGSLAAGNPACLARAPPGRDQIKRLAGRDVCHGRPARSGSGGSYEREVILRKVLFGSTAMIGAIMLASAASAQTAGPKAPFTAILDGEANANFGVLSGTQNSGTNGGHQRDFGMEQNAWMRFFFEAKADNGLTYGWNVRILGTSSTIT